MTAHVDKGKMPAAQRAKMSVAMKAAYAARKKKYGTAKKPGQVEKFRATMRAKREGRKGRRGLEKWTPSQHRKFKATMAARRKEREAVKANGSSVVAYPEAIDIPLHAIPERAPKRVTPRYSRMNGHAPDNQELAKDLLQIAVALLKGKL